MAYPGRCAWAYTTLVGRGGRPAPSRESIEGLAEPSEGISTGSSIEEGVKCVGEESEVVWCGVEGKGV